MIARPRALTWMRRIFAGTFAVLAGRLAARRSAEGRRLTTASDGRPAARDGGECRGRRVRHAWRHGPDPQRRPARAPGSGAGVRARGPPAARGRVRAGGRAASGARRGRGSARRRSRPDWSAGRCRARSAGRAGRCSSRCSSTSSSARSTGGLWSFIPGAYNALIHCSPEQRARYLDPSLRGERFGSYAITEPGAGSDARALAATAVRDAATGEYVLNGEKWFVTGPPDETDFMIFHCLVVDGDAAPADAVPRRLRHARRDDDARPGLHAHLRRPASAVRARRTCACPASAVLGGVGRADDLTNEWFVEERIHIGARCTGAMERLLTLAVEWAGERVQFGERILDFQGVSFPLADSAADAAAARLLTREAAWLADTGADPKVVHAKASMAKLFASEAAFRCADRVVQVFGGRGYMRENPAERFFRELRVDRIWEGTSEIQRLIIARALEKRGVDRVVG